MKKLLVILAVLVMFASCTPPTADTPTTTTESTTTTTIESTTTTIHDHGTTTTTTIPEEDCPPVEGVSCEDNNVSGSIFREAFNGNPDSPEYVVNSLDRWFAQPSLQGPTGWSFWPQEMEAQHMHDCGAPPGTHTINSLDQTIFICRDHMMTAINPPGGGGTASSVIALKPDHMADFTTDEEVVISIDVSTRAFGSGDWWEIWVTPFEDHLIAPVDHWFHQAGPPDRSLLVRIHDFHDRKIITPKVFDNYRFVAGAEAAWDGPNIADIVTNSDTRRDTYEVRIKDRQHVTLWVEDSGSGEMVRVYGLTLPEPFWTDQAIVQFAHSNYRPMENGAVGADPPATLPTTWHWDNAIIKPAVPYTLINTNEFKPAWCGVSDNTFTFREPAPEGSEMMFKAMSWGNAPQISFNGGEWITATAVRPPNDPPVAGFGGDPDFLTYKVPAPAGATGFEVRGSGGCTWTQDPNWSWGAKNFHLIKR